MNIFGGLFLVNIFVALHSDTPTWPYSTWLAIDRHYWSSLGRPARQFRTGFCFTRDVSFFFLFHHSFSELPPSTDRPETLPHGRNLAEFYGGAPPKKIGGQKHAKFWSILDHFRFHREYLRNGWRYPKSAGVTNYSNSSCVQWKKSRELWSTNGLELHVSLDPLKMHFFGIVGRGSPQKNLIVKVKNRA